MGDFLNFPREPISIQTLRFLCKAVSHGVCARVCV